MKLQRSVFVSLLLSLWLLAGCVSVDGTPFTKISVPVPSFEESEESATAESPVTPKVEFPLLPMSDGEPLSALEVFELVSPSVVYVETPRGTGSGVLIEQGYLVSNAHVVWPYNTVRVVFPDGLEYKDVEVVGWDLMADLALLKLPELHEMDATQLNFVDGSELTMGSDVYLIGYPGEVESYPQPTIVQGILARVRTWAATGMEVFQVDADTTGGQSGGVMVTARGEVIGITTFDFTSATFTMVPSAAYGVPRLNALANEPGTAFSDRRLLGLATATEFPGRLDDQRDSDFYILEAEPGEEVKITVEGVGKPFFSGSSVNYGWSSIESEEEDDTTHGSTFTVEEDDSPYIVQVAQQSRFRNDYTLVSSHPLARYTDSDDGTELQVGDVLSGTLDLPDDSDEFTIELKEGERVAVEVDSLVLSPGISLIYERPTILEVVSSYDGGATGVFGENARIIYEAPEDDTYTFIVGGGDVGGYFITTSAAEEDEVVTEPMQSHTYRLSSYGKVELYESEKYDFEIGYPGDWGEIYPCQEGIAACYGLGGEAALYITEEDLEDFPIDVDDMDQEGYVDLSTEVLLSSVQGSKLVSRETITTPQGIVGVKVVVSAQAGLLFISRFVYVNEDAIAFTASYIASARIYEQLEDFLDYSYKSFRVWDEDNLEADPVYHLDEGRRLFGEQDFDAAIDELTEAITLDPELADAYASRASLYYTTGEFDPAIADYEKARELEPQEDDHLTALAMVYWAKGEFETAIEFADQAVEADPEEENMYNIRALIRASAGDYEGALADMDKILEISEEDELLPHFLDSRAYIYLKMEAYDDALTDYNAALDQDFKSPYTLLGAGIAAARLNRMDEALELLDYGMELYEDSGQEYSSPQLADLLEMAAEILDAQ